MGIASITRGWRCLCLSCIYALVHLSTYQQQFTSDSCRMYARVLAAR